MGSKLSVSAIHLLNSANVVSSFCLRNGDDEKDRYSHRESSSCASGRNARGSNLTGVAHNDDSYLLTGGVAIKVTCDFR